MTRHDQKTAKWALCLAFAGSLVVHGGRINANEVDGFTEPFKTVNVAAAETGTIRSIEVREGDVVQQGQILARLNEDVHQAMLAIAEEGMNSRGQMKSAGAELEMRRERLEKLIALREQGHARQEEVDRARTDLEIAEARVLSAHEQIQLKRLEHDKVLVQLERRVVRAPMSGTVSLLYKDEGEFVAPNDPHVLELVCLDPLVASFNVPSHLATRLEIEQKMAVFLEGASQWVEGEVAVISPVTDAESGTVRVKVRIPNEKRKYRSGEHCTLQLRSVRKAK